MNDDQQLRGELQRAGPRVVNTPAWSEIEARGRRARRRRRSVLAVATTVVLLAVSAGGFALWDALRPATTLLITDEMPVGTGTIDPGRSQLLSDITTLPPLADGVPRGSLVKQIDSMPDGTVNDAQHFLLLDFEKKRARSEIYSKGQLRYVTVVDKDRRMDYDTVFEQSRTSPQGFDTFIRGLADSLGGLPIIETKEATIDGRPAFVCRVAPDNRGKGEIVLEYALVYLDKSSGLRFREDWMVGGEKVREITRELVSPAATLETALTLTPMTTEPLLGKPFDNLQDSSPASVPTTLRPE